MNEYQEKYLEKKSAVLSCLENAKEFLSQFDYKKELEIVERHFKNLKEGEFSIVLVGEFSAGKSTFLNALMGKKILPSFSSETTATVNFLKHKNKAKDNESGCVYYRDGTTKLIDNINFETISKYVSTESEEEVSKNISHLDLYLDSKFLENNVTLIDSPGLNGIADGHREITEEQIKRSTASIFLFNANQPGSSTDFEFLRHLQKHIKGIICVLNQIDCIKTTEGQTIESVIDKLKENYKKMIPDAKTIPEIIPVAAYPALVAREHIQMEYNGKIEFSDSEKQHFEEISRMKELENRLWKFLTQGEKTKQELLAPLNQLEAIMIKIQNNKKQKKEIIEGKLDINDLEEKKFELEKEKENLENTLQENKRKIEGDLKLAEDELIEEIVVESNEFKKSYKNKITFWDEIEDIDPIKIKEYVEKKLNEISDDAMSTFRETMGEIVDTYGNDIINKINTKLDDNIIKFTVDGEVEKGQIEFGIERYENDIANLEKELKRLENEKDNIDDDICEFMVKQDKYNEIKKKLENTEKKKEHYEEISQIFPEARYSTEQKREKISPGGIFGGIQYILVGNKYEYVEKEKIDTWERDEYKKERDRIIANYDKKIEKLEKELELSSDSLEKIRQLEREKRKIESIKKQTEEELNKRREDFKKNNEKKIEKELKRLKEEVEEFIDNNVKEFSKEFKKEFRKLEDTIVKIIMDKIGVSVNSKIQNKVEEIKNLQNKMKDAENDKQNTLNKIDNEIKEIQPILSKIISLESDLEDMEVDIIKEEDL